MEIDGPGLSIKGGIHHCYPFFKTLASCINSRFFPKQECALELSEYLECHRGDKRKQAIFMVNQQIFAKKVLSIPIYDPKTDSFKSELPLDN